MKRLISLILTFSMLLGILATGAAFAADKKLPFTDVKDDAWYYSSVKYVYENHIMQGTATTLFEPELTLSRGMGVTLLYRVDGEPEYKGSLIPLFDDVKAGEWYADAVTWAFANDIVKGRSNTEFAPDDDITRAEFAAILSRYAEYADLTLSVKRSGSIADEKDIPEYAREAVKALYEAEVINGRTGNIFDPSAQITRAEAAAMIERFVKNAEEKEPEETDPPVTEPEETDPPVTEPEETDPPVTEPEETDPPITEPEETDPPVTEPEETDPPVTEPEETDPPVTEPEETDPPAVDPGEDLEAYVEEVYESVICVDHKNIDIVLGGSETISEENFLAIAKKILNLDWGKYTLTLVRMEKNPDYWPNVNRQMGGDVYVTYVLNGYEFTWHYWVLKYYTDNGEWYQGKDFKTAIEVPCQDEVNPTVAKKEAQAILDAIINNAKIAKGSDAAEIYAALEAATRGLDTTFYEIEFKKSEAEAAAAKGSGEFTVIVHNLSKYNYLVEGKVAIGAADTETDDGLCIYFFGNSITLQGYSADHFEKLSTNVKIKTVDLSNNGWALSDHLNWLKKWPDYAEMIAEEADIIVLQEYASSFPNDIDYGRSNVAVEIMNLLGRDKEYYVHCGVNIIKGDKVVTVDGDVYESNNNTWFGIAKTQEEKFGYPFIFASDLAYFDPSLGLTTGDTKPDGLHPSAILGYSAALTLYCQIFGVDPTEQNNGVLKDDAIPGDTKAEKDAFMVRLKNTVKDLIEFQNAEMGREVSNPDEPYPPATEPDETDPPITEPEETDPPVTEPEETDPPITEPDDGYIDIYLFGNSITLQGNIDDHLKKFTNGENIRVYDLSNNGWYLENQVEYLKKWPDYAAQIANEADIIIMQEYGGVYPHVGDNKELAEISDNTSGMPAGFCRGDNVVGELMDILGRDKKYYSYTSSLSYGLMKSDEYIDADGRVRESQNEALLRVREIFKEQYNFTHLYVSDLAAFEPEFGFTGRDYTFPDYTHPSPIMGYTAALLLYCEIFGADPTEQGNGALRASDIPAGIEDFDGFMAMVKNAVKEMIELHHSSEDVDPPVTEPEETDPPVTEPDETDPPATEPENVINICLFNSEGVNPFGIVRNLEALQGDGTIKVKDYSKMCWSLSDYIEWLSENPDVAEWIREEGDIILLEEFMSEFPTVGDDADIAAIAANIDTISHDFYKGENVVGQFMELLGEDKEYYSYSSSMCGGVMKYDEYIGPDGELTESKNAELLSIRKILKDKYNITHIFASDIAAFEPALGLSSYGGTFIDNLHALPITGYCTALTVYCEIFGKSAVEQNNGIMTEGFIYGESGEEKFEFMRNVKKVVDEIIAVQNGEVLPLTSSEVNP